ncbi:MAG: type II secretion system F family protein [Treponema sp.]|nr:type II secretion system F family protein [Treponema sp.]
MPHYRCAVSDSNGIKFEILKAANNEDELRLFFNASGQFLISYKLIEERDINKTKRRFSKDIILEFTEIMSNLLKAGLTIQDSLELCGVIATAGKVSNLSKSLLEGVKRGLPFYEVLKIHSSSFTSLYQSLIRLGEKTGSVAGVFARMGSYLHVERKIRLKLGNVLWYPMLILIIALAGCFGIIFFIMPRMTVIFASFNTGSDGSSMLEIQNIYTSLLLTFLVILFILLSVITLFILHRYSERLALLIDKILLQTPLLGGFLKSLQALDFSFAMEMLTGAGITVANALKESASVVSNLAFREAILDVHKKLLKGEKLSSSFFGYKVFPSYIGTWVSVGERTGTVELVFSQVRTFFQNEVEYGSERVMGLIEPVLTLLTGIIVLILVTQFVLPVFSMYGKFL